MPGRLDRVTVSLSRGDVVLTWETWQALMRRLQHLKTTAELRASFDAVGASRSVQLNAGQRANLLNVLEEWSTERSFVSMPEGLVHLRNALSDDLNGNESAATNMSFNS
jgi:hypothetical protein